MLNPITIPDTPEERLKLLESRTLSTEELHLYTEKISTTPSCFKVKTTVLNLLNKFDVDVNIFPKEILNITLRGNYINFNKELDEDTNNMIYIFTTKEVDHQYYEVVIEPDNPEECLIWLSTLRDITYNGEFYNSKGELLPIEI